MNTVVEPVFEISEGVIIRILKLEALELGWLSLEWRRPVDCGSEIVEMRRQDGMCAREIVAVVVVFECHGLFT